MNGFVMGCVAVTAATLLCACGGSSTAQPARPGSDASAAAGHGRADAAADAAVDACADGGCTPFAVCPSGLEPTFDSIRTSLLSVSCGTDGTACHSSAGFMDSGELNLADDPYTNLLGADGMGARASNIAGKARNLKRVVPGDPDHSFLVIKLQTKSSADPDYGSGMPFTAPGSVCPATLDAIRTWITNNASR
ncbi:MAG: hypothetical protein ACHQ53_01600 [Polyangiales bacterium]